MPSNNSIPSDSAQVNPEVITEDLIPTPQQLAAADTAQALKELAVTGACATFRWLSFGADMLSTVFRGADVLATKGDSLARQGTRYFDQVHASIIDNRTEIK